MAKFILSNFVLPNFLNDIALLKLEHPLSLFNGHTVAPICVPEPFETFYGKLHGSHKTEKLLPSILSLQNISKYNSKQIKKFIELTVCTVFLFLPHIISKNL